MDRRSTCKRKAGEGSELLLLGLGEKESQRPCVFIYGETLGDRWVKGGEGLSACAIEIEVTVERRALNSSHGGRGDRECVWRLLVGGRQHWRIAIIVRATESRRGNKGEKVKILAWCISPFTFLVEVHDD
jgi:hypothetical protein